MKKSQIHILFLVLCCQVAYGQGHAKIWNWNDGIQLRFEKDNVLSDTFSPSDFKDIYGTTVRDNDGSSYTDSEGKLVLYTSAGSLYRGNGDLVLNGKNKFLERYDYCSNGSDRNLIIKTKNKNIFIVVSVLRHSESSPSEIKETHSYTRVDLSTYPGRVTQQKTFFSEYVGFRINNLMSVAAYTHPSGDFTWLAILPSLKYDDRNLYLYKISEDTVQLVRSEDLSKAIGSQMNFSNNGNFLAVSGYYTNGDVGSQAIYVFKFDKHTGTFSDKRIVSLKTQQDINQQIWLRSVEFSPNEKYLYTAGFRRTPTDSTFVLQCTNPFIDPDDSLFRRVYTANRVAYTSIIQMGPDGRIYLPANVGKDSFMSTIPYPNLRAPYCGFSQNDIKIKKRMYISGMPNFVQDYICPRLIETDTLCMGTETKISLINDFSDSVELLCNGQTYSFGSLDSMIYPFADTGWRDFGVIYHYPAFTDTLYAQAYIRSKPSNKLPNDTLLCTDEVLMVNVHLLSDEHVEWMDGDQSTSRVVDQEGMYSITLQSDYCESKDTLNVYYADCELEIDHICFGDSTTLSWDDTQIDSLAIQSTYLDTLGSNSPIHKVYPVSDQQTLNYTIYKNGLFRDLSSKFEIIELPTEFLADSLVACESTNLLTKVDVFGYTNQWYYQNDIIPRGRAEGSGRYTLRLSNGACSALDSTFFTRKECFCEVYIPTGFTPNGDGLNDIFGLQTDCDITEGKLTIYNKWGEKLIESTSNNWDGRYLGVNAQTGLYLWNMSYRTPQGELKYESGAVTLLR